MKKIFFAAILIVLGILFRMTWHVGPNVEFVTAAAILAAIYLGRWYAILVPLIIMVVTDRVIGNTNIYYFTWSAYLIIGAMAYLGNKFKVKSSKLKVTAKSLKLIKGLSLGVIAAVFFFLWTNFGVWMLDSWGMYSRDLAGLMKCYEMGLPFFRNNLVGNMVFVPGSIFVIEIVKAIAKRTRLSSEFSEIENRK